MVHRPLLHLVVALKAEARPLVEHLGLQAVAAGPWRLYEGDGVALVVTGVGKAAAAAATAYLAGRTRVRAAAPDPGRAGVQDGGEDGGPGGGRRPDVWLNLGLGGHAEEEIGSGFLAHKVTDAGSGRSWYPPLAFPPPGRTASLLTVERPETAYPGGEVYEMEAAGFFAAAGRLAPLELVHAYKVIADNRERPAPRRLAKSAASDLVAGRLGEVDRLRACLGDLAEELARLEAEPPELDRFLARCRFTVTQRRRLRALLARWGAAGDGAPAWTDELAGHRRAAGLLTALERRINARPLTLAAEPAAATAGPGRDAGAEP